MKKLNKNQNLPIIKVGKITEHKDGSATYEFEYDKDFQDIVSKDLGIKKANKKQVGEYILKCLEEAMDRMDEEENSMEIILPERDLQLGCGKIKEYGRD